MRNSIRTAAALAIFAAALWGYALLDGLRPGHGLTGLSRAAAVELESLPNADDIVARRVWAGDSVDILGRPSPDGRWLSHVEWIDAGNLALRDLRTGETRMLTQKEDGWITDDHALFSVFSPSGDRIAFMWWNSETQEYEIRTVDLGDGEIRTVYAPADPKRYVQPIAWTSRGDRILVTHSGPDWINQIAFMDARDGSLQLLRSLDWRVPGGVALSPDDRWIAYSLPREDEPSVHDVFLLAADGSEEHLLVGSDASEEVVGWLPGGGPFFYLSSDDVTTRLVAQGLDGPHPVGPPRVVRSDLIHARPMGAFGDGFLFSVAVEALQSMVGTVDLAEARLTGPLTPLASALMERAVAPEWTRDGERVVYVINPALGGFSAPVRMAVRSLRTGAERRFPTPFRYVTNIAVHPEGEEVLVQGYGPEGRQGIYRFPLGGDTVHPLELSGLEVTRSRLPAWSSDGRSAYYARWVAEDGDVEGIVRREVATGSVEELFRAERLRGFAVAPDETELAVIRRVPGVPEESHLLVVDLETGEERELVRVSLPDGLRSGPGLSWSPDGTHILYLQSGPNSDGSETLRVVAREGGSPAVIPTDDWVTRPRVHPDGRRIAVVGGANRWEVWTLENLGGIVEDR